MNKLEAAPQSPVTWGVIVCLLLAGASYLTTSGVPTAAYLPYMLVAELAYLTWATSRGRAHLAHTLAFAIKLNVQAAMRASIAFAFGVTLLFALSALPGFSAVAILKLIGRDADPFTGLGALYKMTLAASIGLAAARHAYALRFGVDGKSLDTASYLRPSIRVAAPLHVVEKALAERLAELAQPCAPRLDTVMPSSVVRIKQAEEDGHPITRVFFGFFSLRMTFSVRALDYGRTEIRVWIRLRKSMRLIDLFPNPVAAIKLLCFLEEEVFEPLRRRLGKHGSAGSDARAA